MSKKTAEYIARAPVSVAGRDWRPGDRFEAAADEVAGLMESGEVEATEKEAATAEAAKAETKPAAKAGKAATAQA